MDMMKNIITKLIEGKKAKYEKMIVKQIKDRIELKCTKYESKENSHLFDTAV